eukprot:TRINITY_DN774065_c0_g1_i1.p1 TRINITY_DN774065_c0_g1~~TRINITY_DN774065_c0_g1_i1.p1  ORF type:complete len:216 (+),score=58.38 TRINITY_DN774065_c0_g1_i1:42-689(+)
MPISKRSKVVSLTQTEKKGREEKSELMSDIRECVDLFRYVYVINFFNMRTNSFKLVRGDWKDSRFFLGKNKVMKLALGRAEDDEYSENLHMLSDKLHGHSALFFSNHEPEEVSKYFENFKVPDFPRTGFEVSEAITVPAGDLDMIHTMVEPLRKLGLPVKLDNGVVKVERDHVVCREGDVLKPEQAQLLKLFGHKLATFHLEPVAVWCEGKISEL